MKLKKINYFFISTLSLLLITGCGGGSSSDSKSNVDNATNDEQIAIYIPIEEIEKQKAFSKATPNSVTIDSDLPLIKEDAERDNITNKWRVYDSRPAGAKISIAYDDLKESRVIDFNGEGLKNGYAVGKWTKLGSWNDTKNTIVQWKMNYNETYYIYIRVSTAKGYRYIYYTPSNHNYGIAENYDAPHYIHHGLGKNSTNGTWKTFTRDVKADLKEFDPDNTLTSIDGFFVRGSGRIDDIKLMNKKTPPTPTHTIKSAINAWIKATSFRNEEHLGEKEVTVQRIGKVSQDKTRAVVFISGTDINTDTSHLFDISDLNNIKNLGINLQEYRMDSTQKVMMKDDDYVLLIRVTGVNLYDFHTGKLLNEIHFSPHTEFLLTEENYLVFTTYDSNLGKSILKKYDFTDRNNPKESILYTPETDNVTYTLSFDKSKVIVKDSNGNFVTNVNLNDDDFSLSVKDAINAWIKATSFRNEEHLGEKEVTVQRIGKVSQDKTRAVVFISGTDINTDTSHLFDISDLNNIKNLGINLQEYRMDSTDKIIMKDDDYVLLLRVAEVKLYDFHTGNLLDSSDYSIHTEFLLIDENYLIFRNKKNGIEHELEKYDFTDRNNPIRSVLYTPETDNVTYTLSSDKSKVIVKDSNGNVISNVNLNDDSSLSVKDAINAWIKATSFKKEKNIGEVSVHHIGKVSQDKTRAVVFISGTHRNTDSSHIFDISDLYNIKNLGMIGDEYRMDATQDIIIKDDDYILLTRAVGVKLYDFHTGKFLGEIHYSFNTRLLLIAENYIIFENNHRGIGKEGKNELELEKYDFTDRNNHKRSVLYTPEIDNITYTLSSDKSKVIVKDSNGSVIKEIFI